MLSARGTWGLSQDSGRGRGPRLRRGGGVHGAGTLLGRGSWGCRRSPCRGLPSTEQSQRDADKGVRPPSCCRDVFSKSKIKVSRRGVGGEKQSDAPAWGQAWGAQLLGERP